MTDEPPRKHLPTLTCCRNNVPSEALRRLRASGFSLVEEFCVGHCAVCYAGPFLLVGDEEREELLTGASHFDILEIVRQRYG